MEEQPPLHAEDPTLNSENISLTPPESSLGPVNISQNPEIDEEPGILDRSRNFLSTSLEFAQEELISFCSLPENSTYGPNAKVINAGLKVVGGFLAGVTGYFASKGQIDAGTAVTGIASFTWFGVASLQSRLANREAHDQREMGLR